MSWLSTSWPARTGGSAARGAPAIPCTCPTTTTSGAGRCATSALFELLTLEAFQSGLSWLTILRKRPGFRAAFDGFDVHQVAAYGDDDLARLLADPAIVRNVAKVDATIANARATVALHDQGRTLVDLVFSTPTARGAPRGSLPRPVRAPGRHTVVGGPGQGAEALRLPPSAPRWPTPSCRPRAWSTTSRAAG